MNETQAALFTGGNRGGGKRQRRAPHNGTDTSTQAARQANTTTDRDRVYAAVLRSAGVGMTCDEVEQRLGLSHQTASARCKQLLDERVIVDSTQRRATRSGRSARVYVHVTQVDGATA